MSFAASRLHFTVNRWMGGHALAGFIALALANGSLAETPDPTVTDADAPQDLASALEPGLKPIWQAGFGEGFRTSVQTLTLEAGAAYGPAMMGSQEKHHLALLSLAYGHMIGPVLGENHWYRGNFELRLELFGGVQFYPELDWLVGLTPHARYHFATGTRWIPFLDAGLGVSLTGIGSPDLGSVLEFNLQGGLGAQYYLRDNLALTFEGRYIHISNAGLSDDNYGLNALMGMMGVTFFF